MTDKRTIHWLGASKDQTQDPENSKASSPATVQQRSAATFSRPNIDHHICDICQSIPLELFLGGSRLISDKCRGNHPWGEPCKGIHQISCNACSKDITTIPHDHCNICNEGEFALCEPCMQQAGSCNDSEHRLRKRVTQDRILKYLDYDLISDVVERHYSDKSNERNLGADISHDAMIGQKFIEAVSKPYLLHTNKDSLRRSAESGCHFCAHIQRRLPADDTQIANDAAIYLALHQFPPPEQWVLMTRFTQQVLAEPHLDAGGDWHLPYLLIGCGYSISELAWYGPILYEVDGPKGRFFNREPDWLRNRSPEQISPIAGDVNTLRVISEWIESCSKAHEECIRFQQPSFVPGRLIDVGSGNTGARLVQGSSISLDDDHKYFALSYCWGEMDRVPAWATTQERLVTFEAEIPESILPKTILDAIKVVRANGYRYLWVDSLCIVQDDPDDWAREAKLMAAVYTNAVCTIVSGTDSAQGGLFIPRNQLEVSATEMMAASFTGICQPHKITLFPRLTEFDILDRPTSTRAWCMQEELLSRRLLYFTKEQFVFKCQRERHSEVGMKSPGSTTKTSGGYTRPRYPVDLVYNSSRTTGEWGRIVSEFTSRALTFEKDMFPAIGGVALQISSKYEDDYLAGLWASSIASELLWQRTGNTIERPIAYKAPSWSWLSVKGEVVFERGRGDGVTEEVELVSHKVETIDGYAYSETVSGKLVLKARIIPSYITATPTENSSGTVLLQNSNQSQEENTQLFDNERDALLHAQMNIEDAKQEESDDNHTESPTEQSLDKAEPQLEATSLHDHPEQETPGNPENTRESESQSQHDSKSNSAKQPAGGQVWRSAPWEANENFNLRPPGGRSDMMAAVSAFIPSLNERHQYGTIFFDGEPESKLSEIYVALIATTTRPGSLRDRNGIAMVKVSSGDGKTDVFRRVGFVGFWDKIIKHHAEVLKFLTKGEKTEFVLI